MINPHVIERISDGALYEKGIINLKFKSQIFTFSDLKFGISKLDNMASQYNISKVTQRFPLKKKFEKFTLGDEDLAKFFSFEYDSSIDPFELAKIIFDNNRDILEWAEPSFVYKTDFVPNDPATNTQYHIAKINSFQAWDITQGDTNTIIGIVDSGSDLDHPDLAANIKYNQGEMGLDVNGNDKKSNGIDDDGNGFVDDYRGWDFVGAGSGPDNDPNVYGSNCDHGSHVSGDADQVTNNGVHGSGIGFKCKLLISKHGNDNDFSGTGGVSFIYNSDNGIVYCYQNGAKVINCSFGSGTFSASTQNIVTNAWNAGCVVVCSAGNDGINVARYPASYDNTVSVAASNSADLKASFSTYHPTVDVIAPGESIISTLWDNSYANFNGTSMSSPITAGTVALIRSKYPSFTPAQVVERLKAGVDSIYNLNPTYIGLLGTGRVNAFKCVADKPILAIENISYNDSVFGNNDHVYDVNERIVIPVLLKNSLLGGNNVSVRLTTDDPTVAIVKDSIYLGNIVPYGRFNLTPGNTFEVKALPNCPFDHNVTFKLTATSSSYTLDNANTVTIKFRQGFANHNANNLHLSLTKDGALGKKAEAYGNGLQITGNPSQQMIEGGLMIGISNTKVSDVTRRATAPANVSDSDFTAINSYIINKVGNNEFGDGYFNDNGAGTNKIGITVQQRSFAFSGAADDNAILFRYKIQNTSGAPLNNLYIGQFLFFTPDGLSNPINTAVDSVLRLGYTFNPASGGTYLGSGLITGQPLNYKAILGGDVFNGFTKQEKWDALSGRISVPSASGLVCFSISAGPINLNANDTTTVGFAMVKGTDLNDLKTNFNNARGRFFSSTGINNISQLVPAKFELSQNYPNPFNPVTRIRFAVPVNDVINIKVYDLLGKEVADLYSGSINAGTYEASFDASHLTSGMYFYRMTGKNFTDTKKMMLIK